ncbi:hypothetical protein AADG42_16005 [Ammonicoccus fulvus]|uniref:Signal transduction histidine kinase n=1 Tax=Ammonicoccus fulvus TaxID=3138240 RepID=A0ABZ3FRN9_9ACTN
MVTGLFLVFFLLGQPARATEVAWWPTAAAIAVQGWVLAFGGRWRWWLGGSAWIAYAALRLVATVRSQDPFVIGIIELISNGELAFMLILGVHAVRRLSARADAAEAERSASSLAERRQHVADRRRHQVARFLHDDVMHALRAIAQTGRSGRDRLKSPASGAQIDELRTLVGATADRLRKGDLPQLDEEPGDLRAQLLAIGAATGVRIQVTGRAPRFPARVIAAIVPAAAEAVRNSARHAGVSSVRIHLDPYEGGGRVQVVDDGPGFGRQRLGRGLRESVFGRMQEIGGQADVAPGEAGGTIVTLEWVPAAAHERVATVWREMTGALVPVALPGIIGTALIGVLIAEELANPALATAGMIVAVAVGLGALQSDGVRLSRGWLGLLVGASMVGLGANILAVASEARNGFHLFMAGGVTPLMVILVVHARVRWSLAALCLVWAELFLLGGWHFGFDAMTNSLVGALTAPIAVVGVVGFKLLLRRTGRRMLVAREETINSVVRREALAFAQSDRDERIRRVTQVLLPFLDGIVTGRLDPLAPEVARRAVALELGVRAELETTSDTEHTDLLAAAIAGARARDWELEVRIPPSARERWADQAITLLSALDEGGAASGRATLSALDGLALVVHTPDRATLAGWRARSDLVLEWEEDARWSRLSVRLPAEPGNTILAPA